ncbi:hypothetical protein C8R46DRAFT_1078933 [Mycena filopes]|nr:hypothetical protein C8R46DRAFT_1078933 [Mycena filopes]
MRASKWASTEEGRAAFRSQFSILEATWSRKGLESGLGNALTQDKLSDILTAAPSTAWIRAESGRLHALLSDKESFNVRIPGNAPMARGIQAEFLGTISAYLDRSDTPTDFDEALNENLGVLLKACVDVRQLRTCFPPAVESNWTPAINAIIDAALAPYAWAFQNPNVR